MNAKSNGFNCFNRCHVYRILNEKLLKKNAEKKKEDRGLGHRGEVIF